MHRVEKFVRGPAIVVPTTIPKPPVHEETEATMRATLNADGILTTDCHFEWGATQDLGSIAPCEQGPFADSTDHEVTAHISSLTKGNTYWYRLSAKNGLNNRVSLSGPQRFIAQGLPKFGVITVDKVGTDGARFNANIDPNGGNTTFRVEIGDEAGNYHTVTPESNKFGLLQPEKLSRTVLGLQGNRTYHYRIVATNEAGPTFGPDQVFRTYPSDPSVDNCDNAHVRQQVEASLLFECRAYELVSARNAGGYDVVSDLVPGLAPYDMYPRADDTALYSIDHGIVPGVAGNPTNFGRDPYVSVRTPQGWATRYVGIPATGMSDTGSYGSPLREADPRLTSFVFAGPEICDPCFPDGSTNLPLRKRDGSLVKGMAGGSNPPADPSGEVRRHFSEDGNHLVFAASQPFAALGNAGSVSIYERNLLNDQTQLVSTSTTGTSLTGELAGLDVSADGSRVLVGKVVGADGAGNRLYDLYMHVGNSANSVAVADTLNGVIYNGMTADGDQVYFTAVDQLADDADSSADMFRAEVGPTSATVSRVSTGSGGTGNTDACTPIADWNVSSGGPNCGTVGIAGGAGVAREEGSVYFLSPEKLGGAEGTGDQANLYVVEVGGSPEFVATIDSSLEKPGPQPPKHPMENPNFIAGLSGPANLAIDQANGDIYVAEKNAGQVSRFTSAGAPKTFAATGTNAITGQNLGGGGEGQIAVDSAASSPFKGAIYITNNGNAVKVYANNGEQLGELTGFGEACGVSIDQSNGTLYVGSYPNTVYQYTPISAAKPVTNASYSAPKTINVDVPVCNVEADSSGHVYAKAYNFGGTIKRYNASEFALVPPSVPGTDDRQRQRDADRPGDLGPLCDRGQPDRRLRLVGKPGRKIRLRPDRELGRRRDQRSRQDRLRLERRLGRQIRCRRGPVRADRQPRRTARGPTGRRAQLRRLPGQRRRRLRGVQLGPFADRLPQRGADRRSTATSRTPTASTAPPARRPGRRRRARSSSRPTGST